MNKFIRITSSLMALLMVSGCSSIIKDDVTKYPLVAQLSEKEVVDYYKEALDYDTVVTKNLDIDKVEYETKDVTDETKGKLTELVNTVQGVLGNKEYPHEDGDIKQQVISENVFNYIKTNIDDRSLSNPNMVAFKEALGFYFVDVEYTVGSNTPGAFTDKVALLGLHGAFKKDYTGIDLIDTAFLNKAERKLNEYYIANNIMNTASFDKSNMTFKINSESSPEDFTSANIAEPTPEDTESSSSEAQDEGAEAASDTASTPDDTASSEGTESSDASSEAQEVAEEPRAEIAPGQEVSGRTPLIDVTLFNMVVGSSLSQTAYVPKLDIVYSIPKTTGTICGYGIYPAGTNTLKSIYGFDRNSMEGSMTLRYVFKNDVLDPTTILPVTVYPIIYDMTTGINSEFDVTVPDFIKVEIQKLIERSDRAIMNKDISALMSGKIYTDMGKAVLVGVEDEFVNVQRNMSTLRRIVARPKTSDESYDNSYVVEVETLRIEGPKGSESLGTYKDTHYFAINQVGTEFFITDSLLVSRIMDTEPPINVDDAITKRLVAMNFVGDIPEENKTAINQLMSNLYTAGTQRILRGPKEIQVDGQAVTVENGMYDCFNQDTALLSSSRLEYLNSELREQLIKFGVDNSAEYKGIVTSWMGGKGQQAEFTTEEIIKYSGRDNGHYMKVYYLVSSINDKWVIDERQVLEEEDKSGAELEQIVQRIG